MLHFNNNMTGKIVVEDIRVSIGATAIVERKTSELTYLKLNELVMEYKNIEGMWILLLTIAVKVDGNGPIAFVANKINELGESVQDTLVQLLGQVINEGFKDQLELGMNSRLPFKISNLTLR